MKNKFKSMKFRLLFPLAVILLIENLLLMVFYLRGKVTWYPLMVSVVMSLLFGLLALIIVGSLITNPLQSLLEELRTAKIRQGTRLQPVHINEVDELIDAINNLSDGLEEASFKISKILDASNVPIGVFEYSNKTKQVFCSRSLLKLLELPCRDELYVYMEKDEFVRNMLVLRNPREEGDEQIYELESGDGLHYIRLKMMRSTHGDVTGVLSDVTMEMNERRKLERERNYDQLTNIYNRRAFREKGERVLERQQSAVSAVVMWDLDNLKYVNDTYGHETGDRYIRLFADYLRTLELEGAIVERHSGDEFMAILLNGDEERQRKRICDFMERLRDVKLKVPGGYELPLRASAGVVWYPRQARDFDTLVRYADFAMYMSKHSIKGVLNEFDPGIYQANAYLLSGKEELNTILEKRKIRFALQPIVARDGSIYGYEALMRPELKSLKNIQELLTLAKIQAKLPQLEELTWTGAVEWIRRLLPMLEGECRFFINSIASVSLSNDMIRYLESHYRDILSRIVLEITETEQGDAECMNTKISTIHRWGGLLALDDYGAGYSNEGNLLQINPDLVKMDIELVRNIHIDQNRQAMAKSLISYCHQRGILVLAEGVESLEELEYLVKLHVDLYQGYYLARPELEILPLDRKVMEKMRELSQN